MRQPKELLTSILFKDKINNEDDIIVGWQSEKIFFEAKEIFQSFIEDCQRAKHSIWIEVFSFEDGELLQKLLPVLKEASEEKNIDVRIIVDGIGSLGTKKDFLSQNYPKIQYQVFNPLMNLFLVNRRDHRKLFIIDQSIAYVGSSNIDDKSYNWRESTVRLTGESVHFLVESFYRSWIRVDTEGKSLLLKLSEKAQRFISYPFRFKRLLKNRIILTDSAFDRIKVKKYWIYKIERATSQIYITTPYFIPTSLIYNALLKAAKRGVDIRIVVPAKSNIDLPFMKNIERYYIENLLKHGVKVYEYLPKMIHAKVCILDKQVIIGSSNWNHRSRYLDLELDVILNKTESYRRVYQQFKVDCDQSHLITTENYPPVNLIQKIYCFLLHLIKDWT